MHTAKRHGFLNLLTRAITVEQGGRGCPQILGTHVVLLWNRRFPGAGSEPFRTESTLLDGGLPSGNPAARSRSAARHLDGFSWSPTTSFTRRMSSVLTKSTRDDGIVNRRCNHSGRGSRFGGDTPSGRACSRPSSAVRCQESVDREPPSWCDRDSSRSLRHFHG